MFYNIDPWAAAFMVTEEMEEFWRENNGALSFAQKTSVLMTKGSANVRLGYLLVEIIEAKLG